MQPDAEPADDFDERVVASGQLTQHALNEIVDGGSRIGAEIPAGLPAPFDDGVGSGVRGDLADPRVVLLWGRNVLALGGGLQIGAHGDERTRRVSDQRPKIPVSESGPVPCIAGDSANQACEASGRRLKRCVRARHGA